MSDEDGWHRGRPAMPLSNIVVVLLNRRIHDELPLVAEKYKEFRATGEVTL